MKYSLTLLILPTLINAATIAQDEMTCKVRRQSYHSVVDYVANKTELMPLSEWKHIDGPSPEKTLLRTVTMQKFPKHTNMILAYAVGYPWIKASKSVLSYRVEDLIF